MKEKKMVTSQTKILTCKFILARRVKEPTVKPKKKKKPNQKKKKKHTLTIGCSGKRKGE